MLNTFFHVVPNLFAHEVYVLTPNQIESGQKSHHIFIWHTLNNSHNIALFVFFATLIFSVLALGAYLKWRGTFDRLGKYLDKQSGWAVTLIRVTFGASLIVSATHNALYGPELPLSGFALGGFIKLLMFIFGTLLIVGIATRLSAAVAGLIWLYAFIVKGPYLFTYSNYLGEAIALMLLPITVLSVDGWLVKTRKIKKRVFAYSDYSFSVARILFALSLLYTAFTIKFAHTALTLDVVKDFNLTRYFPFDPLFIVLGAALIEVLVGLAFITGFLQRYTSIIFLLVMALSLLYFKESVWPHYLLIALGIGLFIHKPDKLSLDSRLFVHKSKTPKKTI